jgi:nitrite reductase/ring-hydroxylating ferredoxin subunit
MEAPETTDTWRTPAAAIGPGQTAKFRIRRGARSLDAFIVNHEGRFHAYVNRCPHAGTTLDLWPNEFWTEDNRYLICATHGAIFAPDSGVCVEGPCPGARLERLVVERDGDAVVVSSGSP